MAELDLAAWEGRFEKFLDGQDGSDPGHGLVHVRRVVAAARQLATIERARLEVVLPAAWLHDCVHVAKDSPDRPRASRLAADHAVAWLKAEGYPLEWLDQIHHAIAAHSYSAAIATESIEARVVQDADRLDALGAIGLARCIAVGTSMGRAIYQADDPFCEQRPPDDSAASLDHLYTKLLRLAGTMQTAAGRAEAERRTDFLRAFLAQLKSEIAPTACHMSLPRLLFVCVENANRSQLAAAFARLHGAGHIEAISAGSHPAARVNARARALLGRRGIAVDQLKPKSLSDVSAGPYRAVITMGCGDRCPWIEAEIHEDWALPDPRDLPEVEYHAVANDIEQRVVALLQRLKISGVA